MTVLDRVMEIVDTKTNFFKLNEKAKSIELLYAEAGIRLPPESTLASLIRIVKSVAERRSADPAAGHTHMEMFRAVQLYRVADAILALGDVANRGIYLRKITANLDFFTSEQSSAKDIFWELELWWAIRRKLPSARLEDPPDIVLELDGGSIGIACKAVYSEKSVPKALSTGVRQVKTNCDAGVVAFNIDSIIPPGCVVKEKDKAALDRRFHSEIDGFVKRHHRHIIRYLDDQRLAAVAVYISAVADIYGWSVPFNTVRYGLVYAAGRPTQVVGALLEQFRELMVVDNGSS